MNALNIDSITNQATAASAGNDIEKKAASLSQSDFIELLVAQVRNQDPTKPLDPSEFMNQLAQFSTVNGVQELKGSFDSLATKLSSDQSIKAASLVGRAVLIPGGEALYDGAEPVTGKLSLDGSSPGVNLKVYNQFGEQVRDLALGSQASGDVLFQWDGFDDVGNAMPAGRYDIVAEALVDGQNQAVEVSVETRVNSVSINQELAGYPEATLLNLVTGSSIPLSTVQQIK